jgi:uncharacterized repeat protein (TIGR01451 family)
VSSAPAGPRIVRQARARPPVALATPSRAAAPVVRATPAVAPADLRRGPVAAVPTGPAPATVRIDERVSPAVDSNPARSSHAVVVTVFDAAGRPLPGQRVEWILSRSPAAVGDIVGADDTGKVNNQYAVTTTNASEERLDAGHNHPVMDSSGARLPDVALGVGQTWVTLSSAQEGTTDLLVYVPGIRDATRNKVFARAVWADYDVAFPADVTAVLPDSRREIRVEVRRATDGESLSGQAVEAEILEDSVISSFPGGGRTATATTGPDGVAVFAVENTAGERGATRVRLTARGTFHGAEIERSHVVEVAWRKVELECRVAVAGRDVPVGTPFDATVSVTNRGDAPASDVQIVGDLGLALAPAEGTEFPVAVGAVAPGQTVERLVRLVARVEGDHAASLVVSAPSAAAVARCDASVSAVAGRLALLARCEPAQVEVGGQVRFVVEVRNEGRAPLSGVAVQGVYPDGVTPKTASSVEIGTLPPGASDAYEFLGVATRGGTFRNSARAAAHGVAEATAECELRVLACALEVSVACPEWVALGEAATFRVNVHNAGDGPATGTVLRVSHGACLDGGLLDVPLGDIAPGETRSHDWQAIGVSNATCSVSVEAVARACQARAECEIEVGGLAALDSSMTEQTLARARKSDFRLGEEFLYVLELGNDTGTDHTPPLRVLLTLPRELQFVSAAADDGIAVRGPGGDPKEDVHGVLGDVTGGAVTNEFRLAPGQRVTIQYRVKVVDEPKNSDRLIRVAASVRRASDGTELAAEVESTSIGK